MKRHSSALLSSEDRMEGISATTKPVNDPSSEHHIAFSQDDAQLCRRLAKSKWLARQFYKLPTWLSTVPNFSASPAEIPTDRLVALMSGSAPLDANERRYKRNRAVIKEIEEYLKQSTGPAGHVPKAALTSRLSTPASVGDVGAGRSLAAAGSATINLVNPAVGQHRIDSKPRTQSNKPDEYHTDSGYASTDPRREHVNVSNDVASKTLVHRTQPAIDATATQASSATRSSKRGRALPGLRSLANLCGDDDDDHNSNGVNSHRRRIADDIANEMAKPVPNDNIQLCGMLPIMRMEVAPDDVLELAHKMLHAFPYKHVPKYWRRLYEDASLCKAMKILRNDTAMGVGDGPNKRRKAGEDGLTSNGGQKPASAADDWLKDLVWAVDKGHMLSGSPARSAVFKSIFEELETCVEKEDWKDIPGRFTIPKLPTFQTWRRISRCKTAVSFEGFQNHLTTSTSPLIITHALALWPAMEKWQNPRYFFQSTLGGRRLVPVEIGKCYTDEGWSQKIMSFGDYMRDHVLHEQPHDVGYMAQHDLFAQIPALRDDIMVPDYCYCLPPAPIGAAAQTAGLADAHDLEEPMLNAWIGPKGTKTPLHTDPYHNILCQVVGYKYARLYAPDQTPNVYPRGLDEKGISMMNTSQIDISCLRWKEGSGGNTMHDFETARKIGEKFPKIINAEFQEAVLAPGECLYIPLGWWHYVEALTASVSVSFWWNARGGGESPEAG